MRVGSRIRVCALSTASAMMGALVLDLPVSAAQGSAAASKSYQVEYLTSDGSLPTQNQDPELKNGWGLAASPTGPWFVAANTLQVAKVYDGSGTLQSLRVMIPGPPTGVVFSSGPGFPVTDGTMTGPAQYLFAAENGTISGWSPTVGPPAPSGQAYTAVDRSSSGAVYKGLAIAHTSEGDRLYATDFHNAKVDVFDESFATVVPSGGFIDPKLPAGYAPFGIQTLSGRVFVTFAKQGPNAMDEIAGQSLGVVDVFDTDGVLIAQVAAHGQLDAPWGLAVAPAGFGVFSGDLLVGNFGDGNILAFTMSDDMRKFTPHGVLRDPSSKPIQIDGLWGIAFGNGAESGPTNGLYFAAGPSDESHGALGRITLVATP